MVFTTDIQLAAGSLIKIVIVKYNMQQVIRRHFSLKKSRLSLTMEVLVTIKKKGQTQTRDIDGKAENFLSGPGAF